MVTSGWWSGGEGRAGTAQASAPPGGAHTAGAQRPQQTWPPGTTASASRELPAPGSPHTEPPLPASQALRPGCRRVARVQGHKRGPTQASLMGNAKSRCETPWIPSARETEIQLRLLCAVSLLDSCSSPGSAARDQQEGKAGVRLCCGRASREASACSVDSCRESLGTRPLQRFLTHVCVSCHQAGTDSSHLQCPEDPGHAGVSHGLRSEVPGHTAQTARTRRAGWSWSHPCRAPAAFTCTFTRKSYPLSTRPCRLTPGWRESGGRRRARADESSVSA